MLLGVGWLKSEWEYYLQCLHTLWSILALSKSFIIISFLFSVLKSESHIIFWDKWTIWGEWGWSRSKCAVCKNNVKKKKWCDKKQNGNYRQVSFALQQSLFLFTRFIWNTETLLYISSSKDKHWITDTVWQRRTKALSSSWWTVEGWYCWPLWNLQWKYGGWLFVWIIQRFLFVNTWIFAVRVVDQIYTEAA